MLESASLFVIWYKNCASSELLYYIILYLSSAKNIYTRQEKDIINKSKNTGRGDATAMPITALPRTQVLVYILYSTPTSLPFGAVHVRVVAMSRGSV